MAIPFSKPVYNRRNRSATPRTTIQRPVRFEDLNVSSRNLLVCLVEINQTLLTMLSAQAEGRGVPSALERRSLVQEETVNMKCESESLNPAPVEDPALCEVPETTSDTPELIAVEDGVHALPDLVPLEKFPLSQAEVSVCRVEVEVDVSSQEKIGLPDLIASSGSETRDGRGEDELSSGSGARLGAFLPDIVTCCVPSPAARSALPPHSPCRSPAVVVPTCPAIEQEPNPRNGQVQRSWRLAGLKLKQIADSFESGEAPSSVRDRRRRLRAGQDGAVTVLGEDRSGAVDQVDSELGGGEGEETRNMFAELSVSLLFKFALYVTIRKLHSVL